MDDWFEKKDQVIEKLKNKYEGLKDEEEEDAWFPILFVLFGEGEMYVLRMVSKEHVCYYFHYPDNNQKTYTVKLPDYYNIETLKKDTQLWRKSKETIEQEEKMIHGRQFYAEDEDFDFDKVVSGGTVRTYKLNQDIKIINFNRCYRRYIWGEGKLSSLDTEDFEELLKYVCEQKGAQGWRAAAREDQPDSTKDFNEKAKFEICVFDHYTKRDEPEEPEELVEPEEPEEHVETKYTLRF